MILEITESLPERTSARLLWEGRARPDVRLHADFAPKRCGPTMRSDADGWFLAAALLADWKGEERVDTDAAVCPELRENIRDSLALFSGWEGHRPRATPVLSASTPPAAASPCTGSAAPFFSSGVDSLWTLFRNRETYRAGDFRRH